MIRRVLKQIWRRTWRSTDIRRGLIEAFYALGLLRTKFCKERAINLHSSPFFPHPKGGLKMRHFLCYEVRLNEGFQRVEKNDKKEKL